MANKEILCVYQDCVLCGDRGKKVREIAVRKHLAIRKVSFASEEGRALIHEAVYNHEIGSLPFFTDGVKFSRSIEDMFVEKPAESTKKSSEKPAKSVKRTRKRKGAKA